MKKLLAVFLCILLSAALFTACSFPMHEHIEGQWEFNASQHWQNVTCSWHTCNINIVSYDHIDENEDKLCDVCSYRPLMIMEGKWHFSDSHHWQTPEGDAVFTPVYGYGEHIDEDTNRKCDVCGYLMLESLVIEWQYNDTYHWCPKGDSIGCLFFISPHIDEDTNSICDVCGYKKSIDTETDNVQ